MTCSDRTPLLNAYFDGELELSGSLEMEQHLAGCPVCSATYEKLQFLRKEIADADLDYGANADLTRLRTSIRRRIQRSEPRVPLWRSPWMVAVAAATIVMAVLIPFRPGTGINAIHREVLDDHLRSLMSDHLVQIESSDHHNVKPWFEGKLNFSPPVPELGAQGFVLAGGRTDVISGRNAAALVYYRRKHVINLLIAPAENRTSSPEERQLDGFNLIHWQAGSFGYWAVSDLNVAELREFVALVRRQAR
jgi:anti-sigma factor RsiW